jgi:aspartate carbamoyltransferase catalytic subunit
MGGRRPKEQNKARPAPMHLLDTYSVDLGLLERILEEAKSFAEVLTRPVPHVPALKGKTVATAFFEPSTRTRLSFELAAKRLSADVISFTAKSSSTEKGESLKDTILTLVAMGADCVVLRHSASGAAALASRWASVPVINAGDGMHQHPTQALADALTILDHKGRIGGLQVAIVGDILHSRVARSGVWLLSRLGAEVVCVGPPPLLPPEPEGWPCRFSHDLDGTLPGSDVVMLLRLQMERGAGASLSSLEEYRELYGLTSERLQLLQEGALVMHPGPVNRGVEIDSEVLDSDIAVVCDQVEAGSAVRMAALYVLCSEHRAG